MKDVPLWLFICYKIRTTFIRSPLINQQEGEEENDKEKERSYGIH
jgi:hypothetical protein